MTVREIIGLCGGYNFNYRISPRERTGYFYPSKMVKWQETKDYFMQYHEILDREVAHISALEKNTFEIFYYVTQEDIKRINAERLKA